MIRRIGRRESEASPTRVDIKGWAATTPPSMRMVLPELPQSSGAAGARRPRSAAAVNGDERGFARRGPRRFVRR